MAVFATARARRTIEGSRGRRDQVQVSTEVSQTRHLRRILQVESTRARAEVQRARASSRQGGGEKRPAAEAQCRRVFTEAQGAFFDSGGPPRRALVCEDKKRVRAADLNETELKFDR